MAANQRPCDALYRAAVPLSSRREPDQGFEHRATAEDEDPQTRTSSMRDMKVTLGDLKKYGYTEIGCPRCDYIKEHGNATNCGHAHSKICRDRIKQKLSESEAGRARLAAVDERLKRVRRQDGDGGDALEHRAAEELVREGLPEAARQRVVAARESDSGTKTPIGTDSEEDDSMSEAGDENEEMGDEEAFEPESVDSDNEDEDMGLLENDTALERLFKLSSEISEEAMSLKAILDILSFL